MKPCQASIQIVEDSTSQAARPVTKAQKKVILRALNRPAPHFICPTPGLWANAQTLVIESLRKKGLVIEVASPRLTEAGIAFAKTIA
jgi:hypothetical protein